MGDGGSKSEPSLPRSVARLVLWVGAIGTVVGVGAQVAGLFNGSGERTISQGELEARIEAQRAQLDSQRERERRVAAQAAARAPRPHRRAP